MWSQISLFAQHLPLLAQFPKNPPGFCMVSRCGSDGMVDSLQKQEFPYWHDDGECITLLYYPNNVDSLDEGGETQFYIENKIIGIPYKPDRLITFDGRIPHKATAFRTQTRYTIAVKYKQSPWS